MVLKAQFWWGLLAVIGLLYACLVGIDQGSRYLSWRNLSKEELVASANWYVDHRAPGNRFCLYAVTCENGRAQLTLVKDLNVWDLNAAKQRVWDRRFSGTCQGRTANFALQALPDGHDLWPGNKRAVWSFHNDRFVPRMTKWEGHAFSEIEPEACSEPFVIS